MKKIDIFDTTLRDGEQSAGVNLHMNEKLEIAFQLERYGVNVMEAGYPASSEGDFKAVKRIAQEIKNCSVTGLARCVKGDIDAAWEALKEGVDPRLHVFIATSPIHMKYKLRMTEEETIEAAVEAVKYAKRFFPKVQWSAEDATRSDKDFLVKIITKVIEAGASVINLPDTVGYIYPQEYGELIRYIRENVPNINQVKLSAHCHDDLGLAVANSLAAIENGVEQIEGTINGIGERAGNAALEEIGVALYVRKDYFQVETTLNLGQTMRTSQLVSKLTGMSVQSNKAVVGANALAHESGIHQDGVLKHKQTYEIIEPELIGLSSNRMVLGKHSGRHAFREKCKEMGLQLSDEAFEKLFKDFKDLTSKKKEVTEDDILMLVMNNHADAKERQYELKFIQVAYGSHVVPTTTVGIKDLNGQTVQESATGKGSVESLYNAIQRVLDSDVKLLDYRIQSTTSGIDSLAEVYVKVNYHNQTSSGRGVAHDVLEASAKAYLDAVNRILFREQYLEAKGDSETVKGVNVL